MRDCEIGYEHKNSYGNKPEKYLICTGVHPSSEYQYKINTCKKRNDKLSTHIVAQYANCEDIYKGNIV